MNSHSPPYRAVLLGLLVVVGFTVAGCYSVFLRYEIIGTGYLPRGGIFALLLLVLVNALLRRAVRSSGLKRPEILLVFAMIVAMAAVPGQEYAQHVYLNQLGIVYYATPEIARPDLYLEKLNPWAVPSTSRDDPVVRWAFEGLPPGEPVPYGPWLRPLLVWTPFYFGLYWTILCGSALIALRWEDQEKVLFPLVNIPVEIVGADGETGPKLLRNKLLWGCFALSTALYVVKGLHTYFPAIPDINLQRQAGELFAGPAVAFNGFAIHFYPEMIGISYLLAAEVGFSLWFFYWLRLFEEFFRNAVGLTSDHWDFFAFQSVGSYIVLGVALMWSARPYLRDVAAAAFRRPTALGPRAQQEPFRLALFGFAAGMALVVGWCVWIGMAPPWALVQYVLFPLVSLVVARVICEAGMFLYSAPFRLNDIISQIAGASRVGPMNITYMTMTSWAEIRSTAQMNMPSLLHGFKLGTIARLQRHHVLWSMAAAIGVAILVCHVTSLHVIYKWSVPKLGWWPSGSSLNTTSSLAQMISRPEDMQAGDWGAIGLGAGVTLLLVAMRQRFIWWPFHPLGFVAWLGWPIDRYWLSIAIGWLAKVLTVRLGGYKAFATGRPAAFGLILGICFILTVWLIIHLFYPGPPLLIE